MRILMIFADQFAYNPRTKTIEEFETITRGETYKDILVAFIQAEEKDMQESKAVENKLLKNLKWAAKKNNTRKIMLHSFAHLSESKAEPHFTKEIFDAVEKRLINAEYEAFQSPFGYFLDLDLRAPGVSQARIFKSF